MSIDPQRSYDNARRCAERASTTRHPRLKAELLQLSRNYLRRSIEVERSIAVWTGLLRSHGESRLWWPSLGNLRDRLEQAGRHVAACEVLVAGWRDVLQQQKADGRDVTTGREMLEIFCADLEAAISEKERAENLIKKRLRDFFVGAKGRRPYSDDELDEWLASAEGKAATAFEPAPLPASTESRRRS